MPIESYINYGTKIKHKCLVCDSVIFLSPSKIINRGCSVCNRKSAAEKNKQLRTKNHRWYLQRIKDKDIKYQPLDDYQNYHTKIKHQCYKCQHIWKSTPSNILQGRGCPVCGLASVGQKVTERQTKTHEQYLQELKELRINYTPVEKYRGYKIKIKHKCPEGHTYIVSPRGLIVSGYRCRQCYEIGQVRTHKQYLQRLKQLRIKYTPLEEFQGANNKIRHKCHKCSREWQVTPWNIYGLRRGCPSCGGTEKKTDIWFKEKLKEVHSGKIITTEKYCGIDTQIKYKCTECDTEWKTTPYHIIYSKTGCPYCVRVQKTSKPERFILSYIKNLLPGIDINHSNRNTIRNPKTGLFLELDIYMPELKLAFEFNGTYWHSVKDKSELKSYLCSQQNIKLIHISETDYNNNWRSVSTKIRYEINQALAQLPELVA